MVNILLTLHHHLCELLKENYQLNEVFQSMDIFMAFYLQI